MSISATKSFSDTYPKASVGILITDLHEFQFNPDDLKKQVDKIITNLKIHFQDSHTVRDDPVIKAYSSYYKSFKKSYHVLAQLESVIFKNKPLPFFNPVLYLVFAAELKNMLLTAVHDLDSIVHPITIDIASGGEEYTALNGAPQQLKPGDMFIRDNSGVISSVIYGPDRRTRVIGTTRKILLAIYAPAGVSRGKVNDHLDEIVELLYLISPTLEVKLKEILPSL